VTHSPLKASATVGPPAPDDAVDALARLRPLLEIAAVTGGDGELEPLLDELCAAIAVALEPRLLVFHVYRAAWDDFEVTTVHGDAGGSLGTTTDWDDWRPLLAGTQRQANGNALLHMPLAHSDGHLLGILCVGWSRKPSQDDLDLLTTVAALAARALEHAQRNVERARTGAALEHLHTVSAQLSSQASAADVVLREVSDGIARALGFDKVAIVARDGDSFVPAAFTGFEALDPAMDFRIGLPEIADLFEARFEVEGCYLLEREEALARCPSGSRYRSQLNGRGPWAWNRHWLLAPLYDDREALVGFIWVDDPTDRLLPSRERLRVLRMFANHASTALELARTFEAEHDATERLRASITASPLATFGVDHEGAITSWNPAAERLYGWTAGELVGKPYPLASSERRLEFEHLLRSVLDGNSFSGLEITREARDGQRVEVSASSAPIRNADGDVTGAIVLHQDITERKQAERELERRHRELGALHRTTLELIESLDEDGVLVAIVQRACDLLGTENGYVFMVDEAAEELVCRHGIGAFAEVVGARLRRGEGVAGKVWASGETLSIADYDAWRGRSEQYRHLAFRAVASVPLRSRRGVIGVFGIGRLDDVQFTRADLDLLEQFGRLASLALDNAQSYTALRKSVTERERNEVRRRELEEQLRQSQKMEAIGRLSGGIAHDFNNLLTAIAGYGGLALGAVPDGNDELARDIEEMLGAAERARQLIRQLLAFSRKQVMQPRVLDLNEVVCDMESILGRLIGENIELVTSLEPSLGQTHADPSQIEQVVMNLAINARDAMEDGGRLVIETTNEVLDTDFAALHLDAPVGPVVALRVADNGYGMTEDVRERVFEPFFTTKGEANGTGLGLSTVYGIVKQSGGTVLCESNPGEGAAFTVYLPRFEAEALEARAEERMQQATLGGSETILVVEDEEVVRRLVAETLGRLGYTVLVAESGEEAVAKLGDASVDLVLTDVVMPGMGGRLLAAWVREHLPETGVVFMSGYDSESDGGGALPVDAPLLEKPFTAGALAAKTRAVLDDLS